MPGRDRTGPLGQGAMTGGGFGNCVVQEDMYYQNRNRFSNAGRGAYCGRGRGFGGGFRNRYNAGGNFPANISTPQVDKKQYLENELRNLEQEINSVKKRLTEIDSD